MGVVIEATGVDERCIQGIFAAVPERRMTKVMGQAQSFGQILVEAQCPSDRSPDLRNFDAVREPNAVMVAVGRHEDLRLVAQASKGDGVDDPIPVSLENIARTPRAAGKFRMKAAARAVWACG